MVDVIPSSISVCSQIFNTAGSANNVKLILIPSPTTSSFNPEVFAASPDQDIHAPLDLSCKSGTRRDAIDLVLYQFCSPKELLQGMNRVHFELYV